MSRPVHVVAVGARTPVGYTAESSAAAVRAGISRIAEHPFMVDLRGEPVSLARDGSLDAGLFGPPRLLELACSALSAILKTLGPAAGRARPVLLGLPEPRSGFTMSDVAWLAHELGAASGLAEPDVRTLASGSASALELVRQACQMIAEDQTDLCLVGGVDSYLDPDALLWVDGQGRLLAKGTRSGFPPGEGAAFIALASDRARRSLQLPSLAVVRGAHSEVEEKLIWGDEVNLGEGLTAAIASATADLRRRVEMVDDVFCDLNGERYRVEEWGFAALRAGDLLRRPSPRPSGVASWGDSGAASGALLVVLAVRAWRRGYAGGPRALLWASSDGGLRSAVVLENAGVTKEGS